RASKATPYEESIHIPFIVRYPRAIAAGGRTDVLTSSVDAMPTLLSLCGLEIPGGVQGTDLAWAARGEEGTGPDSVFLQILGPGWPHRSRDYHRLEGGGGEIGNRWVGFWRGVRDERWVYARWHGGQYGPWLFDRREDPFEMKNLAGLPEHAARVEKMEARLRKWLAETGDPFEAGERDPETGELLLGQEFIHERWVRQ
ncbi:MAG: sulfatase/phosphatase domain-containing protein, partial [Planctomycetota bacterium]